MATYGTNRKCQQLYDIQQHNISEIVGKTSITCSSLALTTLTQTLSDAAATDNEVFRHKHPHLSQHSATNITFVFGLI